MANDYPQYQAVPLTTLFTYSLKVSQSARMMSGHLSVDQRWLFVGLNFERVDDCRFCEPKSFPSGWSDGASTVPGDLDLTKERKESQSQHDCCV